jgi:hypothetical protein
MTFEQFQATRQWCDDLAAALPDEVVEPGARGNLYCGSLFIEDTSAWPQTAPGQGRGHWYTRIANMEYQSDRLEDVERPLYRFAISEGLTG